MDTDFFKQGLGKLKDLADIFIQAFEQSFTPVVITEANLEEPGPRFVYVNPAFLEMSGYSVEELSGKTPRILQGEKTDRKLLDKLKKTIKAGEFFRGSTYNYKKDGTEYIVEWNISPIKNRDGDIIYYISMQKDITIEVQLDKERENSLKQQEKMAIMGEMLEVILHQWKQPLNVISLLFSEMIDSIERDRIDKKMVENIEDTINKQIDFMVRTIADFREFVRPTTKNEPFLMQKAINSLVFLFHKSFASEGIDIVLQKCSDDIRVDGNFSEFQQVLLNLLSNSKDAIKEKMKQSSDIDGYISIKCHKSQKLATVEVIDNGIGITQESAKNIFNKHFTTKKEGNGVGLAISRKIVESMGGRLYLGESKDGAKFIIELPLYVE